MSNEISALELNETEEVADTVALAKPPRAESTKQVETASRKTHRKKSGSLVKTMDKLVFAAALGLLCLWFLGHGLLWLIGGSSGSGSSGLAQSSSINGSSGAALAQLDSEQAPAEEEQPDSEMSAVGSDFESEVTTTNSQADDLQDSADNDLAVAESGDQSWQTSQADTQSQNLESEPAEIPSAPPTETSFRPTYSPAESIAPESSGSSTTGDLGGLNWERKKPEVETDQWSTEQTPAWEADPATIDDTGEFGIDDGGQLGVDQAEVEMELGSDVGPIGKLEVEPETQGPADAPMVEVVVEPPVTQPTVETSEKQLASPKTYAMRVWTSSKGSKANLALVRVEGDNVVVVDGKGTEFSLPFARFSEEDQAYVRDAIAN